MIDCVFLKQRYDAHTVKPRDKQCLGIKNDHTNRWACGNQTPILLTKVIHHKQCIRRKQSFWGMLIPRFYCTVILRILAAVRILGYSERCEGDVSHV